MHSSRRTDNYYYSSLILPIHQRFIDIENRVRKWRFLSRNSGTHRSTSVEVKKQRRPKEIEIYTSCPTVPIPRRFVGMIPTRRPRPTLDPVSTSSSDSFSPEEVANRFETINKNSGMLIINGKAFFNVDPEEIVTMSELGEGTCGSVYKCQYKGRSLAVKRMRRTDNEIESKRIFMDLDVIRKCNDCPYIVQCYGYIMTFEYLFIYMEIMATCLEKLLQQRKRGIPEEIIGKITLSVVNALNYLKETHKIMHRDVKPSNILLDWHGNVKLCDFGISGKLIDSKAQTMSCGCVAYLAPERIQMDGSVRQYDVRADVWSLGITLVQLATGIFPYNSSTPFELMVKIREEAPPCLKPENGFSPEFCDFIKDCLEKDMTGRPKFKDLLEKPFLIRASTDSVDVGLWLTNPEEYTPIRT